MSRSRTLTSSLLISVLVAGSLAAATTANALPLPPVVPSYDSYAKPHRIDGSGLGVDSVTIDLSALTTQKKERLSNLETPGSPIYRTGWLSWVAKKNGHATFVVHAADFGATDANTTLALFTGSSIATAKRIAFNDNIAFDNTLSKLVSVPVKKGVVYHLQVGVPSSTAAPVGGTASVAVFADYAPANDAVSKAKTLTKGPGYIYASLNGATVEAWESAVPGATQTKTAWFSFAAAADGIVTLAPWREIGTDYGFTSYGERSTVAVYLKGLTLPPTSVPLTDEGTLAPSYSFAVTKGSTYLIQVGDATSLGEPPVALALVSYTVTYTSPWIRSVTPAKGKLAGGYTIAISGEGFNGTTDTVTIGGRVAPVVTDSATSIVVTVPKGKSKSGYAVVVNGVSNSVRFIYN